MKKIPTLFKRDPNDMRHVTDEVTPGCEWVFEGEGRATRKYEADPQSGAGNCRHCGGAEHHRRHPHQFRETLVDSTHCVCALPRQAKAHKL